MYSTSYYYVMQIYSNHVKYAYYLFDLTFRELGFPWVFTRMAHTMYQLDSFTHSQSLAVTEIGRLFKVRANSSMPSQLTRYEIFRVLISL